jgi:hypothetical protein
MSSIEGRAVQRWLGSLGRLTPRPLKHSHLKKHTAVARATVVNPLKPICKELKQPCDRAADERPISKPPDECEKKSVFYNGRFSYNGGRVQFVPKPSPSAATGFDINKFLDITFCPNQNKFQVKVTDATGEKRYTLEYWCPPCASLGFCPTPPPCLSRSSPPPSPPSPPPPSPPSPTPPSLPSPPPPSPSFTSPPSTCTCSAEIDALQAAHAAEIEAIRQFVGRLRPRRRHHHPRRRRRRRRRRHRHPRRRRRRARRRRRLRRTRRYRRHRRRRHRPRRRRPRHQHRRCHPRRRRPPRPRAPTRS